MSKGYFYGENRVKLRINDPCGRIYCGTGWERTRENSLNLRDWELWLVWRGSGWMRTRSGSHPLFAGFCALMRPGGIYDAGHDESDPLGITFIHFDINLGGPKGGTTRTHGRAPFANAQASFGKAQASFGKEGGQMAKSGNAESQPLATANQLMCRDVKPETWPEFFLLDDIEYADLLTSRILGLLDNNLPAATTLLHAFLSDLLEREPIAETAWQPDGTDNANNPNAARSALEAAGTAKGAVAMVGASRRLPHYRELRQLFARLRTTSPEALPSVAQMAAQTGLSHEHFSRLFRKVNGQSPMRFIVSLRINHARHLLRESSLSVTEIAEHLGYSDVYFFSRQFKEQTGASPLSYRRQG